MPEQTATQRIVEQDNAQIQALIDALDKAEDARSLAYHTGQEIEFAEIAVAQASHKVTMALRSFWRTGYRLCRETSSEPDRLRAIEAAARAVCEGATVFPDAGSWLVDETDMDALRQALGMGENGAGGGEG